jgi:hypothetical protein
MWLCMKQDTNFNEKLFTLTQLNCDELAIALTQILEGDRDKFHEIQRILSSVGLSFYAFGEESVDLMFRSKCEKAMKLEYQDFWGVLDTFALHIRDCVEIHRLESGRSEFFGPYTSVLQSSGKGKTHLLLRYAKEVLALYVSLGKPESPCFPPGNIHVVPLMISIKSEADMLKLLCRLYNLTIRRALRELLKEEFKNVKRDPDVRALFLKVFSEEQEAHSGGKEKFFKDLLNEDCTIESLLVNLKTWEDMGYGEIWKHITLLLDEARSLLFEDSKSDAQSPFTFLRQAIYRMDNFSSSHIYSSG